MASLEPRTVTLDHEDAARLETILDHPDNDLSERDEALLRRLIEEYDAGGEE